MSLFNGITGNYILALLLFAIVAKLIFLPLDIKQQKNSIKQAKMRPKEMAIRNKYKGRTDRNTQMKMQQEIQDMYQAEGYSPFSGCLPMLIQFPIIILLYTVIREPISYIVGMEKDVVTAMVESLNALFPDASTKFIFGDQIAMTAQINALTAEQIEAFTSAVKAVDPEFVFDAFKNSLPSFDLFGVNFGYSPEEMTSIKGSIFNWLILVPALNFGIQFLSTKLMRLFQPQPIGQDEASKKSMAIMEFTLPLMTVFFSYKMSGAIGIYWIFQNIVSLGERFVISKLMPLPTYTEEEIKEMEKAAKLAAKAREQARAAGTSASNGEKPRSLHRIDEDDDDTPPAVTKPKAKVISEPTEQEKKNAKIADKMLGETPKLKDESDKYNKKKN